MKSSYLLSLHGNPRTGKDTLANLLCQRHGFFRLGYGDALYEEVSRAFGVSIADMRTDAWKTHPQESLALFHCIDPGFYNLMTTKHEQAATHPRTSRQILQWWGTEYRREQNPSYWIGRLAASASGLWDLGHRRIVINDCRFPDEAQWHLLQLIRGTYEDGAIIEICRKEAPVPNKHASNEPISPVVITNTFDNDASPEDLYRAVVSYLELE